MSEQEMHDCSDVLEQLYAFHDHELSDEEADHIREHLMACEPCLDSFQVEEALRLLIRKSCDSEAVASANLRVRVQTTFTQTVVVTDAD
ncbi:MAG: mycothiol system anti-sigma-R factor [Actinobacteria bacterium HGW-Actinobacteria-2]|nr:MAG: mycothiol system anti-sigma-R factor [Actinobacteria bacterium HGW-Actinobacteria-2]